MRIVILLILLICNIEHCESKVDSSKNNRKFHFEIGSSFVDMIGNDNDYYQRVKNWSPSFSLKYHLYKSYFLAIQYQNVNIGTKYYLMNVDNLENMKPGSTLLYSFKFYKLNFGNTYKIQKIAISPFFSINYRRGFGEEFFVEYMTTSLWGEYLTSRSEYSSVGAGIGFNANYIFENRISLGFESNLNYNFENINPQPYTSIDPKDYDFKPSKYSSFLNIHLGLLFL